MRTATIFQFIRFSCVGALAALGNTLIIVAFTELMGFHYLTSYVLCFVLVTGGAYLANRSWTFGLGSGAKWHEFAKYVSYSIVALLVALCVTEGLVRLGLVYYVAAYLAAIAMAPINFVAHRLFSFELGFDKVQQ